MTLPIYLYGHPVLRKSCKEVTPDYQELKQLIEDMFTTLEKSGGVGLAAPQVGLSLRLFIVDLDPYKEEIPEYAGIKKVVINPEFVARSEDTVVMEEGCLSIPGIYEKVERSEKVKIKYVDENFEEHIEECDNWLARVMQHEYDHIDTHVFIDRISPIRRRMIKGKLTSIQKRKVNTKYKSV